jgi:hypothetical protein
MKNQHHHGEKSWQNQYFYWKELLSNENCKHDIYWTKWCNQEEHYTFPFQICLIKCVFLIINEFVQISKIAI